VLVTLLGLFGAPIVIRRPGNCYPLDLSVCLCLYGRLRAVLSLATSLFDDKLSWKPQIEKSVIQLSKSACGMLFKLKNYTNISVFKFCLLCSFSFLFNLLNTQSRKNTPHTSRPGGTNYSGKLSCRPVA